MLQITWRELTLGIPKEVLKSQSSKMKGKDELNCKAFERHCKGSSLQSELQGAMGGLKCHHRKGSVFDSFINDSTEDALWAENLAGQD